MSSQHILEKLDWHAIDLCHTCHRLILSPWLKALGGGGGSVTKNYTKKEEVECSHKMHGHALFWERIFGALKEIMHWMESVRFSQILNIPYSSIASDEVWLPLMAILGLME